MRWNRAPHKLGDRRTRKKFAIVPVTIGDTWVWLEHYMVVQERMKDPLDEWPCHFWGFVKRYLPEDTP